MCSLSFNVAKRKHVLTFNAIHISIPFIYIYMYYIIYGHVRYYFKFSDLILFTPLKKSHYEWEGLYNGWPYKQRGKTTNPDAINYELGIWCKELDWSLDLEIRFCVSDVERVIIDQNFNPNGRFPIPVKCIIITVVYFFCTNTYYWD